MSNFHNKRFSGLRTISYHLRAALRRKPRNPAVTLLTLPLEILELILVYIEDKEIPPLRLMSQDLNRKLTHTFGKRCLRIVHTSLSWADLKRLQAISEHAELRDHVRVLKIADDVKQSFWQHPRLEVGREDGKEPYPGIETFKAILSGGLRNCRSFQMNSMAEDWDSHNGWLRPSSSKSSDAFAILLCVIADLQLQVEEFKIRFTGTDERFTARPRWDQQTLLMEQYFKTGFQVAWEGLQSLEMVHKGSPFNLEWVVPLITSATNLKELKISLGYVSSHASLFELSEAEYLPAVEKLKIGQNQASQSALIKFVLRCGQNLRYLSIWHVHLTAGTWKAAFREMKSGLLCLEEVSIAHVREPSGVNRWKGVVFPGLLDDPKGGRVAARSMNIFVGIEGVERHKVLGATYVGPKAGDFLGLLEMCAVVTIF